MFIPLGDDIERRTFPVLPVILIFANVLVFSLQNRLWTEAVDAGYKGDEPPPSVIEFTETWGLVPTDLAQGRVVGVVTHMFLHAGLLHLVGNMIFLWAFSCSLEVGLGRWRLLAFYLVCGVVGGLAHALFHLSDDLPLVGASGAVAGLIGAHTVLYGLGSQIKGVLLLGITPVRMSIPAWLFGLVWFILQFDLSEILGFEFLGLGADPESGIAWNAHIGGFLAGVVAMEIFRYKTKTSLVRGDGGDLFFEEGTSAAAPDVGQLRDATLAMPQICPECGQELTEQCRITDVLSRCENRECGRMIYLEGVSQPAIPGS